MNKHQVNKLRMIEATHLVLEEITGQMIATPVLLSARQMFNAKLSELHDELGVQITAMLGLSDQKYAVRSLLITEAQNIASALMGWALENNNVEMRARMTFKESTLKRMPGSQLVIWCRNLLQLAQAEDYSDYGADFQALQTYENVLLQYEEWVNKPRTNVGIRVKATSKVKRLMSELTVVLNYRLDPAVKKIAQVSPDMYDRYKNARIIINLSSPDFSDESPPES